jgi:hypothetical protein
MSKYSSSVITKVGDAVRITCKICDRVILYGAGEDPASKRCSRCGHRFGGQPQNYADTIDASFETHNRYSWFCGECEHHGLKWIEKGGSFLSECPNCNVPLLDCSVRVIDPMNGRCKTIWESEQPVRVKPITKPAALKAGNCLSCGRLYSYRMIAPYRCNECGSRGSNFRPNMDEMVQS